jgi:speckle-type POZ protein
MFDFVQNSLTGRYFHFWPSVDLNANVYARDIEKLFNSEKFSDVNIVCGTESFLCHKNILAARSDVFATMFEMTDSTENHKEDVQVDGYHAKIMKKLLAFIYGNTIEFDFDQLFPLMSAAEKYNLPVLENYCMDALNIYEQIL